MSASLKCVPVYWTGTPDKDCDLCQTPIGETFIDGRTVYGPWAAMCPSCHLLKGTGLGAGRGQCFQHQADGRWLKVG